MKLEIVLLSSYANRVGVGIGDVTGPAAEQGMVINWKYSVSH